MIKIAIDCRMIGSGGIGAYINGLIPFFLHDNPCLLIGTHEQCMKYLRMQNAEFCYCDVKPFSFRELALFPHAVIDKINEYDVYYTPYCNIPSGIKIPVYATIHDVVFLDVPELVSRTGKLIRKWFYNRAIKKSKAIITVSKFSKKRIISTLHCKKPILVAYSGPSEWLFDNDDDSTPSVKTDTILFVGNIKKHKGLHILLSAFLKARSKGFTSTLVIVGNSDNFRTKDNTIMNEIKSAPQGSIIFTGKIADNELRKIYRQAKFLVQPSIYEGFGLPPLEALLLGTNVLLSDIPVFKEIYAGFPVSFFKSEDSEDLAKYLLVMAENQSIPLNIPQIYSFEKSAKKIISIF